MENDFSKIAKQLKEYKTVQGIMKFVNLGIRAESWHTMFITNYLKYNNKDSYALTYHSESKIDKELLRICEEYKAQGRNDYLVFFSI